jgi:hypothetical protein
MKTPNTNLDKKIDFFERYGESVLKCASELLHELGKHEERKADHGN